jgi:Peptidase M1 N-terminal domain
MKMKFTVAVPTIRLRMHAKDMTKITASVKVDGPPNPPELLSSIILPTDDKDFLDLMLTDILPASPRTFYEVTIEYEGKLNDELDGFYRSSYVNYRGDTV